jgi:hypothetical protein
VGANNEGTPLGNASKPNVGNGGLACSGLLLLAASVAGWAGPGQGKREGGRGASAFWELASASLASSRSIYNTTTP